MNKTMAKLIASLLSVVVAATLVVMSSYAWLTLSAEPEVGGISLQIGGSTTILLAADMSVTNEDGTVSHYPGAFSQNLSFTDYDSYNYIQTLGPLSPVSTADGVNWVLADYYEESDEKVQMGQAVVGQLKDVSELPVDNTLQFANLAQQEQSASGCYAYLDFWVVSPAENYELRVSTGNDTDTGTFVVSRMEAVENQDGSGYVLAEGEQTAATSVRIGFLANRDWASLADNLTYLGSADYNDDYTHLMGCYQEPGQSAAEYASARNTFTIYEPNGDLHKDGSGHYQITQPLGVTDGVVSPVNVSDRVTVQLASRWKTVGPEGETLLAQEFHTATFGIRPDDADREEVMQNFYQRRLQGLLAPYITNGMFVNSTAALYAAADQSGIVSSDSIALRTADGATDDVTIAVLQKNVPQRIRMFIWLEGQDADCVNQEDISSFFVNLELAGS